jgi:N-acetylmuramoyl-L-alanine amidase
MALIKDVTDCSTFAVRGLDIQLIYQMNKISPGLLVRIDDLNVSLSGSVHAWMQASAKQNLAKAIADRNQKMDQFGLSHHCWSNVAADSLSQ